MTSTLRFSWGSKPDPCAEAAKVVADARRGLDDKVAERILAVCPEGAVGYLAKGFRLERLGKPDQAIAEYRRAIRADDSPCPTFNQPRELLASLHDDEILREKPQKDSAAKPRKGKASSKHRKKNHSARKSRRK